MYTQLRQEKKIFPMMPSSMALPETFFNPKQAWEKANHSSKKKTQG